jgi:small GTP-binding protein
MIRVDGSICKLEIWDTAGQERFATITANYYRGAQGALVVYDVSVRESFVHAVTWFERARQLGGENLVALLIGNKSDLSDSQRQVSTAEGEQLARELNIPFLETSALNGSNVEAAFVKMSSRIKASVDSRGLTGVKQSALKQTGGVKLTTEDKKASSSLSCCS